MSREHISAFADGEVAEATLPAALEVLHTHEGQARWNLYHYIGDTLRSDDLAGNVSADFTARMAARMAAEPPLAANDGAPARPALAVTRERGQPRAPMAGDPAEATAARAGAIPVFAAPARRRSGARLPVVRGPAAARPATPMFPILRTLQQWYAMRSSVQALTHLTLSVSAVGVALTLVAAAALFASPQLISHSTEDANGMANMGWGSVPASAALAPDVLPSRRAPAAAPADDDSRNGHAGDRYGDYLLAHQEFSPSPYRAAQYVRSVPLATDASR